MLAAVVVSWPEATQERAPEAGPPTMRPQEPPARTRSVSVDFAQVVDPSTDWSAIDARLDEAGVNAVELSAGRVEFTAYDWPAHPEAAAEPGTDHLTQAALGLHEAADGTVRQIGLIVDTYVPNWLAQHPDAAGVAADGRRSEYQASASELTHGEVGRRLVAYAGALAQRYDPAEISISELFLDGYTFGADDLRLYRRMTGQADWPRNADGSIDQDAPRIYAWRADVIARFLARVRTRLDAARDGAGARIELAMEARIGWQDPSRGDLRSGHDYEVLLGPADRLVLWAYLYGIRRPVQIRQVLASLERTGLAMTRLTVSVGLWKGGPKIEDRGAIAPRTFRAALRAAETHGITSVNVTPLSLMSERHWEVLASVWDPPQPVGASTTASGSRTTTTVPRPGALSIVRVPPWSATTVWTKARPRPTPAIRRRRVSRER